jgi:hypothetical protein
MALEGWIRCFLPTRKFPRRRPVSGNRCTERLECKTLLSAFVVTTPLDLSDVALGDGIAAAANGLTSLRSAVQEANALPGPDTIILPPGDFALFWLDFTGDAAIGESRGNPLSISDDLTIIGAGSSGTRIDGAWAASVFELKNDATLSLGWLTVRDAAGASVAINSAPINSGRFVEIADVVHDSVVQAPSEPETGNLPDDTSSTIPVADLNTSRTRIETLAANQRQSQLLNLLFNRPVQVSPADRLLVPVQPAATPAGTPLDAMLGIRNPGPASDHAASSAEIGIPHRIADSAGDTDAKRIALPEMRREPELRREEVVNSLFQADSDSSRDGIKPTAATDQSGEPQTEATSIRDDSPPDLPGLFPLLPELDTPPAETELPAIRSAAPLLPPLESELPEIRVDDPAGSPRRGTVLSMALAGLLASALRFRSSRQADHALSTCRFNTKWATRVDALI